MYMCLRFDWIEPNIVNILFVILAICIPDATEFYVNVGGLMDVSVVMAMDGKENR